MKYTIRPSMDDNLQLIAPLACLKIWTRHVDMTLVITLMLSLVSLGQKPYQNRSPQTQRYPYSETAVEARSVSFNDAARAPYLDQSASYQSAQSNNRPWQTHSSGQPDKLPSNRSQQGNFFENGFSNDMNGQNHHHSPFPPIQTHQQRRQSQSFRPQVRLPTPKTQNNDYPTTNSGNRNTPPKPQEAKMRAPHPSKPTSSSRRHKNSNSNSSKASSGSNPWSNFTPTKNSTQPSSPETSEQLGALDKKTSALSLEDTQAADKEWLLLREQTFAKPEVKKDIDPYADVHPVIRKWAAHDFPEVKLREPRWANAVLSRRWQREEELEIDKREWLARRQRGEIEPWPQGCRTEEEERAHQIAMESLKMLREMIDRDIERTTTTEQAQNETSQSSGSRDIGG